MANQNIKDNILTLNDKEQKSYKAYATEETRLKDELEACKLNNICSDLEKDKIKKRLTDIENLVHQEQKKDELRRNVQDVTSPKNVHQRELNPTEVSTPNVAKKSHDKNGTILSNYDALKEEISNMKYLIEYMNNNNKKINL